MVAPRPADSETSRNPVAAELAVVVDQRLARPVRRKIHRLVVGVMSTTRCSKTARCSRLQGSGTKVMPW